MSDISFPKRSGRHMERKKPAQAARAITRVAIYTRISTDETNQPHSLEAQRKLLESFVTSQDGWSITHRFSDQRSGATKDRVELQEALRAARLGEFDVLLVYRLDRLARKQAIVLDLLNELNDCGVMFRSATEAIDTTTPSGKMLTGLLGTSARLLSSSVTRSSSASSRGSRRRPPEGTGWAASRRSGTGSLVTSRRS